MEIKTEFFSLRQVTPLGEVVVPNSYNNRKDRITVDLGHLTRNDEAVVSFEYLSDTHDIIGIEGECGCTNASNYHKEEKGRWQIVLKYNTSRIGIQDKGEILKNVIVNLTNGERINFLLKIHEKNNI